MGRRIIADGLEIVQRAPSTSFWPWCGKKFWPELVAARTQGGRAYRLHNQLFEIVVRNPSSPARPR
jgi:hypothetical protein